MSHISQNIYIFCHFDEVSAIRKPKMRMFSITGSQIFFADFIVYTKNKRKTSYQFIVHTTDILALLKAQISLQLGKVFSSDNGVSVSIMYLYTY